jgi:hypothetical protein
MRTPEVAARWRGGGEGLMWRRSPAVRVVRHSTVRVVRQSTVDPVSSAAWG